MKDRIILVIADSGLTKSRFADRLKITPAFLSQICSGVRMPSDRTISDICREFRVNETWLRTGEGEMRTESTQRDQLEQFFKEIGEVCEKYSKKGEGDGKHGHTVGVIVAPPGEMS